MEVPTSDQDAAVANLNKPIPKKRSASPDYFKGSAEATKFKTLFQTALGKITSNDTKNIVYHNLGIR